MKSKGVVAHASQSIAEDPVFLANSQIKQSVSPSSSPRKSAVSPNPVRPGKIDPKLLSRYN